MNNFSINSFNLQQPNETPVDPYPVYDPPTEPVPAPSPIPNPEPLPEPNPNPPSEPFPMPPEPIPANLPDVIF